MTRTTHLRHVPRDIIKRDMCMTNVFGLNIVYNYILIGL